jgi:hypothetical protein
LHSFGYWTGLSGSVCSLLTGIFWQHDSMYVIVVVQQLQLSIFALRHLLALTACRQGWIKITLSGASNRRTSDFGVSTEQGALL